ncbi:MAG: ferritin-like domain-containing protein [Polyangia bacterium]
MDKAQAKQPEKPFELDLKKIRAQARAHMKDGAVTKANTADHSRVVKVLNEALATELVCVARYKAHYYAAQGPRGKVIAAEFLEHAGEEQAHADAIAERLDQLGGPINLNPEGMVGRSHTEYSPGSDDLKAMLIENLVAERVAIETYTEIVRWLGDHDVTTRRLMEDILAKEEEHADDLAKLLEGM